MYVSILNASDQDSTKTLMLKPEKEPKAIDIIKGNDKLPSASDRYLPAQDSAYQKAIEMHIPFLTRAREDIMYSEGAWNYTQKIFEGTPWQIAMKDILRLNPDLFKPSDVALATHEYHIRRSMYVPYVNTIPVSGLKIPLKDIGVFLGTVEDVSPKISYSLDYTTEVEVVIYSIRASVIATLYKGVQKPGNYTLTWNLRDQNGKPMPPGDYIAEVRIGTERYVRKRIEIP